LASVEIASSLALLAMTGQGEVPPTGIRRRRGPNNVPFHSDGRIAIAEPNLIEQRSNQRMEHRILVVDDDREIIRLLRASLEQAGYEVLVANDGEMALHMLRREHPDLVVLDLMLPDREGWEVTRVMRGDASLADTPVIMLTARVEHQERIAGLELGADDYVTKPFHPGELLARIRAVLRRAQPGPAALRVIRAGGLAIDVDAHRVEMWGKAVALTPTEFGLLPALAEHRGQALTRLEMIERGLGYSYQGIERTVDSHIRNLRRKLAEAGAPEDLVETVYGVGYRLGGGAS
jgi:two-component system alkaline phosphatase synthesis response regulator PhoP